MSLYSFLTVLIVMAVVSVGCKKDSEYSLEGLAKAIPSCDAIGDFHDGLAKVIKGEKYGYIDLKGNEVVPCKYICLEEETFDNFSEGLACVYNGNKFGYIDNTGKEVIPFIYQNGGCFHDGLAKVMKNDKWGFIDKSGKEITPITFDYVLDFHEGMAVVYKEGYYGYIDKSGEIVIDCKYETESEYNSESNFSDGLAYVFNGDKYGYIDKTGKEIIPFEYSSASNFSEGLAAVEKDNKWGFIDISGKVIIPFDYTWVSDFSEGASFVFNGDNGFVIDKTGKVLFENKYESHSPFSEGLAYVGKSYNSDGNTSMLYGFVDLTGREVVPCAYISVDNFSEGLAVVYNGDSYGYIDKEGNSTFDIKNEEVKKIVEEKVKAKQEKQKKEEEERRRYEEEHSATNIFNSLAKQYMWYVKFSYGEDDNNPRYIELYFYPNSKTTGEVSIVQGWEDLFYGKSYISTYEDNSFRTSYEISDDIISFNESAKVYKQGYYLEKIKILKTSDNSVELKDYVHDNWRINKKTKNASDDPFNKKKKQTLMD